jgi:predicted nucleotidyltransferase
LAISPAHCDLLLALARSEPARRVVIIGAAALGHHVPLVRGTADVDLVIVAEAEEIAVLLASLGWERDATQKQRWRDRGHNAVDVLPASASVIAAGKVTLADDERVLSTVGFDLVLAHASDVAIPGTDSNVEVASLATIVVLKMVAWLDRPDERQKDLEDLGRVFEAAIDDWDDRRWEVPLADLEHEVQSAFFVGREVAAIARDAHRAKVDDFLAKVAKGWTATIGAGGLVCTDPTAVAERRLAAFRQAMSVALG